MKKLVCFDLDGTLIDTLPDLAASVNRALRLEGLPARTMDEIKSFIGDGVVTLLKRSSNPIEDDATQARLKRLFDEHYSLHFHDESIAYDGMNELIEELTRQDIKVIVYTNKSAEFVSPIMRRYYPDAQFEALLGKRAGYLLKPDAKQLKIAQMKHGFTDEECVYIGDSDVDYATAVNANMDFIGVDWGYRTREELAEVGVKTICSTAEEVLAEILKFTNNC